MRYISRIMEKKVKAYCTQFPVVAVTGPRQSGKSTMLLQMLKNKYQYVTFDDYRMVRFLQDDPEKFMQLYSKKIIFDEVQKVPLLFNLIKLAVDKNRTSYGNFVLTGSSQFVMLKKISESLAGRLGLLTLLPFQYREIPDTMKAKSIYSGSYPELIQQKYRNKENWYAGYLETYLNKDVRDMAGIGELRDFRRFIELLAANVSHVLDLTHYANDIGVAVSTIKRWVLLLEASYVLFLLPPYYKNYNKRIIKRPKLYFYDTGLAAFLTGISNKVLYEKGPMSGALFENYIVSEVAKKQYHADTKYNLYYLRTSHGKEIDLIVDKKNKKDLIEIKFSSSFKPKMIHVVEEFRQAEDKGILLYNGTNFPYGEEIKIWNYQEYLSA
ncbi:ATP-binding protein [bacterium]|nr:ATP-binding protein [bacterium]